MIIIFVIVLNVVNDEALMRGTELRSNNGYGECSLIELFDKDV